MTNEQAQALAHMRAAFNHPPDMLYAAVSPSMIGDSIEPVRIEGHLTPDGLAEVLITQLENTPPADWPPPPPRS